MGIMKLQKGVNGRGANGQALYTQLLDELRQQIVDGLLIPGDRLPSESQLMDAYGISRGTVRHALSNLVNEGLIERTHGAGSFVRAPSAPIMTGISDPAPHLDRQIGIVLSQSGDQLSMEILIGIERSAKLHDYQVIFTYSEDNARQQRRDIERLRDNGINQFIIFPVGRDPVQEAIAELDQADMTYVLVDRYFPDIDSNYVTADNFTGGYRATEHLAILGHQQIGFVYGTKVSLSLTSVADRLRGYQKALADYGLTYHEDLVYQRPDTERNYDDYLKSEHRPSAVFASNDREALAIIKSARVCGVRIPQDLALVGFDDLSFTGHLSVPLTTVAQPRTDIGFHAAKILINAVENGEEKRQHIVLPVNLVVRESCGIKLRTARTVRP
jgi:GntR family transcriptional regulator, arabinose operon transcriptional repressor